MHKVKTIIALLFVVLLISFFISPASASAVKEVLLIKEIDLPEDLNFSVSNSCTGHAYFMQAAADETGAFIVYSRHYDSTNIANTDYKKVYVDIYDPNGDFLYEVSFTTPLDLAVNLDRNLVHIYFYKSVLIYNITTQELQNFEISPGEAVNGGLFSELRKSTFIAGKWTYGYKKVSNGYVELFRTCNNEKQVLVEMPGTGQLMWKIYLPGCIFAVATSLLTLFLLHKVAQRRTHPVD